MSEIKIAASTKKILKDYLQKHKKTDLATIYFLYLEHTHDIHPVVYVGNRTIYCRQSQAIELLSQSQQLWRETQIKISVDRQSVNEYTKRIYICPFSGKAFGDNTHPNPQDAIYDWVSKCPENKEIVGGLRSKRFFVSDDPEVIKNYIKGPQKAIEKHVYSSVANGKLYNSKEKVVEDFKANYLKAMSLLEVQSQNRFQMHESLLAFLQKQLEEEQITAFVEALSQDESFVPYVQEWMQESAE